MAAAPVDKVPPVITHARVSSAPMGSPIVIQARIEDSSGIFAPSVLFRIRGTKEFDTIELKKRDEVFEATIPAEQVTADLEYFIEAFDDQGNGPARVGDPERPNLIRVARPGESLALDAVTPPPITEPEEGGGGGVPWWLWVALGAAAVGGTATALALSGGGVEAVDIVVRAPNPVEALP
ncbi:MAG: hypothetical protein HYV07_26870 [Deltaproteobacteria bacterium]|nr:hypothetical protein [Deltaproteobacteria bacterium]